MSEVIITVENHGKRESRKRPAALSFAQELVLLEKLRDRVLVLRRRLRLPSRNP